MAVLLGAASCVPLVAVASSSRQVAPSDSSRGRYTRVEFVGATAVDEAELRRALELPFRDAGLRAALRRLGQLYYERGFLQATLLPEPAPDGLLRLRIDEGGRTRIANVFVRGAEVLGNQEARAILGLRSGEVFRGPQVEARLRLLLEEYALRGYLYATAAIERLEMTPDGVVLGLAISEGVHPTLSEVQVQGNTHSRARLVRRLAGLGASERVDLRRIRQSTQLLRRSGLFAAVHAPVLYRAGGGGTQVGVLLRVVDMERRNTIFATVGVAQDPRDDDAYLSGAVDLHLRNIWGTGRDLDVAWKRDALAGSNLALHYRERFLLGWPLDLKLDLTQTERDSTYTFQSVGGAVVLPLGRNLSLEAGTAFDRSVFHTGLQGNAKRFRHRVGLLFQSLTTEIELRRFGTLEVNAEYARKTNDFRFGGVEDRSKFSQTLWNGRFEAGVPLAPRHVLAARGAWHVIDSDEDEISESELFYFGGARTLRGYREEQFRGDQVAWGGIEYRFGDPRAGRLYTFFDVGGLRRKRSDGSIDAEVHAGYGLGLRGQVATGVFDLSFGMGEERSFAGTKVHVSLLQRF